MNSSGKSGTIHNIRLWEAEIARENSIPFDSNWYTIDSYTRAAMIASKIVRNVLENMELKQARAKVK